MKRIIGIGLLMLLVAVACDKKRALKTEAGSLIDTFEDHTYLALWKSKYYPKVWKSFDQLDKPFGVIKINSSNEIKKINVKFWLADSTLRLISDKANISYTKTYFLDTIYIKDVSNSSNWFEVKQIMNDTAFFQLEVNELKESLEELREKYSLKIHCHFEDTNGIGYDTTFYSNFNKDWMKK